MHDHFGVLYPLATRRLARLRLRLGISSAGKYLVSAGLALLLLMAGSVTLMMWQGRVAALKDVHQNVGKLGMAISEQTSRSIQAVDIVLQSFQKDIAKDHIETPEQFRLRLASETWFSTLRNADISLPQANAFTIIDAAGKLVNFSRQWPIPATDLSDRSYFNYFRGHDDLNLFVSDPVQNRGDGTWTAYIVRRVDGQSGEFLGLVMGALDLGYFRDFYKALTVDSGTTVTLLKTDGTPLVSYPATARIGEKLPLDTPWHAIVARGKPDAFRTQGVLAPGLRVVSVHPLLDYPIVVNVSVSEHDSLTNWRKGASLAALGTSSALICVVLLLRALMQQFRMLEKSEASLARKSATLHTTLGHMNQGIIMVEPDGTVAVCNEQALAMLDLPLNLAASLPNLISLVDRQKAVDAIGTEDEKTLAAFGPLSHELSSYERKLLNGRVLEVQSVALAGGGMVRTYADITDRRASEERIRYFAHHDDLTKLVNRVMFQERMEHAVELADRGKRSLAVLYLDLDRFKVVNDTKGHGVGDMLLVEVAIRLRQAVRDTDTVARMGGDEFAIIQPLIEQPSSSTRLAERLVHAMKQPFEISGTLCHIGVSIGIALYPDHATNIGSLLRSADIALYRAKSDGRGSYCVYDEAMDQRQQQMFVLEQELRQAIDEQQFELDYQPIIDITTGRIASFEALLRWRHPERGLIQPSDFIELAEVSGLIIPLGLWVIEAACVQAAAWPDDVQIAVNLSPLQFNQQGLLGDLALILEKTGLPPERLVLEVTEGLLLRDTSVVMDTMARMRALGVRLALDDFGIAHAGLSCLRRFPFEIIKIDRSFIHEMVIEPGAHAIVAAVLGMGKALDLEVIAEGVESEDQLQQLRQMGCRLAQGFLLGRPSSAANAEKGFRREAIALT